MILPIFGYCSKMVDFKAPKLHRLQLYTYVTSEVTLPCTVILVQLANPILLKKFNFRKFDL